MKRKVYLAQTPLSDSTSCTAHVMPRIASTPLKGPVGGSSEVTRIEGALLVKGRASIPGTEIPVLGYQHYAVQDNVPLLAKRTTYTA